MRFSIIIPVYQAEKTITRCLSSITGQRFPDFQVLIVDDGSTDGSAAAAEAFVRQDSRFSLIPSIHGGPGAARNIGLSLAQGEYVLYMDADDYWIREDLLQELDQRIRATPADVYMYQMAKVTEDGTILNRYNKQPFARADSVQPLKDVYFDLVADGHTLAAAWNKCVRRKLMIDNGIRFREDVIGEDIDWVLQLFSHVQTICLLNIRAYAYTQHHHVSRSTRADGPNDLVTIVHHWQQQLTREDLAHPEAVAGLVAFEYSICMGSFHRLSRENKRILRKNVRLLEYGLDRKTKLICKFHRAFGFRLTCLAIRIYLLLRRIW